MFPSFKCVLRAIPSLYSLCQVAVEGFCIVPKLWVEEEVGEVGEQKFKYSLVPLFHVRGGQTKWRGCLESWQRVSKDAEHFATRQIPRFEGPHIDTPPREISSIEFSLFLPRQIAIMVYVRQEKLPNLKQYKYSGVDHSLVSRYVLKPFYTNVVIKCFPMSMAPNLITLTGFSFVVVNLLTLLWYNPTLDQDCPPWVYASWAVGLFLYQTFDAVDGSQA